MVDDRDCQFAGKMAGIDKKLTRSLEQEVTSLLVLWMSVKIDVTSFMMPKCLAANLIFFAGLL